MRVKICGIRRMEDALLAAELGANAIGFVFWPSSPRYVEPECAARLADALPPFVTTVGVFVDQPFHYVANVAERLRLGAVQLHGQEPPASYAGSPVRIIKSVAVADGLDAEQVVMAIPSDVTVLLDAHDPIKRGGTGRTIDWSRASAIARQRPIVLSGGLDADNVRDALRIVRPSAIDVSSGVERAPGVKDPDRLRALFVALRAAAERAGAESEQ
jgi:phosphoribosylanthranilate isomerase